MNPSCSELCTVCKGPVDALLVAEADANSCACETIIWVHTKCFVARNNNRLTHCGNCMQQLPDATKHRFEEIQDAMLANARLGDDLNAAIEAFNEANEHVRHCSSLVSESRDKIHSLCKNKR